MVNVGKTIINHLGNGKKNATYKNGDLGDGLVYPHYWLKKPNRELLQYRSGSFVIHCSAVFPWSL